VVPAAWLSLVASLVLASAGHTLAVLFAGRLLAGVGSGAMFSAGTAWLRELSPEGAHAARRTAVAMTAGFALGPLVAGLLAQWAPDAGMVPYLPHVALALVVLAMLRGAPETAGGPATTPAAAALPPRRGALGAMGVRSSGDRVRAAPDGRRRQPRHRRHRARRGGHGAHGVLRRPRAADRPAAGRARRCHGPARTCSRPRHGRSHGRLPDRLAARAVRDRARQRLRTLPRGGPHRGAADGRRAR